MGFVFRPFSRRQRQLLNWWRPGSGHEHQRFVLADGAIRSGKTIAMILSFFLWSQTCHEGREFIVAGVTSGALKRNVLLPLFSMLDALGIPYEWKRGEGMVVIGTNRYFLFGADKDNAQDKLQGICFNLTQPLRRMNTEYAEMRIKIPYFAQFSEVRFLYPSTVRYMDGI